MHPSLSICVMQLERDSSVKIECRHRPKHDDALPTDGVADDALKSV